MVEPSDLSQHARSETLTEVLTAAGVNRDSIVRVTGPAGLAALLWFSRHGFNQVGYVRADKHPLVDGDLLLIPQTCDAPVLDAILSHGPGVRPGGVLIVQTPEPAEAKLDPIHELLKRHGYAIERCLHGRHREMHVARRVAPTLAAAA